MARRKRGPASAEQVLEPAVPACAACGATSWIAYHRRRRLVTLEGSVALRLKMRRCHNPACALFNQSLRPEGEGALALPHGEVGLDVIALIGALRYAEHRSVPEIHQALTQRGVLLAERTVTNLLQRYEELVALRLGDQARLKERLHQQGRVLLALDGLQPDVGHEVLWVLRDCLSGEVLLARSLLSATAQDLAVLLTEGQHALPVPIRGVLSDGQVSIRNAVNAALPGVPHQLCQFHYLKEAAHPIYEADRHAKKELKKQVRGVRPIERQLEGRDDTEAEAVRGYCLAVRSALTDDGRPPLCASGLKLRDRLVDIHTSITRVAENRELPKELARLDALLARGLVATAELWPGIAQCYAWVHKIAHLLANTDNLEVELVRCAVRRVLYEMGQERDALGALAGAISHFRRVSRSFWLGLFHCYQVADLPRTNNDLEQLFGAARYHERRASGRKVASPSLVVRGAVRVVAAIAGRQRRLGAAELCPGDLPAWRALRGQLDRRHESRRRQLRFRRKPALYLAALEAALLKPSLPS